MYLNQNDVFPMQDDEAQTIYASSVCGPIAVALAAKDVIAGKTIRFALCKRNDSDAPVIVEIITWSRVPGWGIRYHGANNDPMADGSFQLASENSADDPVMVAALMACVLMRGQSGGWLFRLKVDDD
jgi:hypothetical protein